MSRHIWNWMRRFRKFLARFESFNREAISRVEQRFQPVSIPSDRQDACPTGRRLGRLFKGLAVVSTAVFSSSVVFAAEPAAGQHAGAGVEPGRQAEKDWVDHRWNRMEVGPFLASNLEIGGRSVMKALSLRVGEGSFATVAFDTEHCVVRGGWTGGFLRFDPARFGLLNAPRMAGELEFAASPTVGWLGAKPRYTGLHQGASRPVLEYQVDETRVLDAPWMETRSGRQVFVRVLEFGPRASTRRLVLADKAAGASAFQQTDFRGWTITTATDQAHFALRGERADLVVEDGHLVLRISPGREPVRCQLLQWKAAAEQGNEREAVISGIEPMGDLSAMMRPGPARWLPELSTVGQRALDTDYLVTDTLTAPYANPWNALMFMAGVDFTAPDTAYVCTIHGDVWRVTGIDESLRQLSWKRFATGLFQPLGLKVRAGRVYVLGRDQVTRLHDENGDGEADFYENFCNLIETMPGHNYVAGLELDEHRRFYYVDSAGVHRVAADGRSVETLATGFRNPNSLGVSPDGRIITVAPQQGNWTPSSVIFEVKPGGYYGYPGPKIEAARPLGYDAPLCWIPHSVDNSSGSQVWIPPGRWGPFGGQMLHLLWGRCGAMLVLRDTAGGAAQGAVVPLPVRFLSGPNRATFHPHDGHLYVASGTGWQTSAVRDGALQRVRFTRPPNLLPVGWRARADGLELTFSEPLAREMAEDTESFAIRQWNYRYAASYGSKEWSVRQPEKEGRDELPIRSARLRADGRTVFLEISDLRAVMQMEIQYDLSTLAGRSVRGQFWLTVHSTSPSSSQ